MTRVADFDRAQKMMTRLLISYGVISKCLKEIKDPNTNKHKRQSLISVARHERERIREINAELETYKTMGAVGTLGAEIK